MSVRIRALRGRFRPDLGLAPPVRLRELLLRPRAPPEGLSTPKAGGVRRTQLAWSTEVPRRRPPRRSRRLGPDPRRAAGEGRWREITGQRRRGRGGLAGGLPAAIRVLQHRAVGSPRPAVCRTATHWARRVLATSMRSRLGESSVGKLPELLVLVPVCYQCSTRAPASAGP